MQTIGPISRKGVVALTLIYLSVSSLPSLGQKAPELPAETRAKIDEIARDGLSVTGVPSASVAVVKDEKIVYVQAYGDARLDPKTPARPEMRYSAGSISKQFTTAAVLMLPGAGKTLA